jgi:exodeoxyribonuclease V gamma subunit
MLLEALTVEHKLQPFSLEYFKKPEAGSAYFTYAREWQQGMPKEATIASTAAPRLPNPIFEKPIALKHLIGFLKDPVKTFFRDRLSIYYEADDLTSDDQEPFVIDPLATWSIQNELIQARADALHLDGDEQAAVDNQLQRIKRRGNLPAGHMANLLENEFVEPLDEMFKDYRLAIENWPDALEDEAVSLSLTIVDQDIEFADWLTNIRCDALGNRCRIELNSSNLIKDQHYRRDKLLSAWVIHLASHLTGKPMTSILIGKNGEVRLKQMEPEVAKQEFLMLCEAYIEGLCHPLPFAPKTSLSWLEAKGEEFSGDLIDYKHKAVEKSQKSYEGDYKLHGEVENNAYLLRIYPNFETLWSDGAFTLWAHRLLKKLTETIGKDLPKDAGGKQ